jgi:hypothetical protein
VIEVLQQATAAVMRQAVLGTAVVIAEQSCVVAATSVRHGLVATNCCCCVIGPVFAGGNQLCNGLV